MHVLTEVDLATIANLRERDEFFWVDLANPSDDEVERLGQQLDLHPLALEDTREFGQRPKLDPYPTHVLLVFFTARATGDDAWPAEPLEVHIYLSGGFMVTVRRDECTMIEALHERLSEIDTHDEEALVYRLLDALTDAYYPVIATVEESVDALEGEVLRRPQREHLRRGYRLKQCVHQLHRLVSAQRDQFQAARDAIVNLKGLEKGSRPYLRDVGDHLTQVAGEFQRQIDDLTALMQTYFNANSERLNRVATRLTIGGTLFVVYTVVTGFFGQNFAWLVRNIDSKRDFLLYGVGGIVVPTVILLTLFWVKRRDWF
ncbi:MAG TPA: magnesium transporter CorA family protein [Solirubrobacter sp.]|nr:magnesium transporter CorA family protein [Solirubrobacter sp.]